MTKTIRLGLVILAFSLAASVGFLSCRSSKGPGGSADSYPWVTINENYQPADSVESFIKNDSAMRGLLPVSIRNYGHDAAVLRHFKGSRFAGPNQAVLQMFFKGLRDWKLVDLEYKNEKKMQVRRTVLYVDDGGAWTVADSGTLMK
jgi:hypothetical protein